MFIMAEDGIIEIDDKIKSISPKISKICKCDDSAGTADAPIYINGITSQIWEFVDKYMKLEKVKLPEKATYTQPEKNIPPAYHEFMQYFITGLDKIYNLETMEELIAGCVQIGDELDLYLKCVQLLEISHLVKIIALVRCSMFVGKSPEFLKKIMFHKL